MESGAKHLSFGAAIGIGIMIGVVIASILQVEPMRQTAIEHGCAAYDEKTGEFGWKR